MDKITEIRIKRIEQSFRLERKDAVLIDCMDELDRIYTMFMSEVLKVESNPSKDEYAAQTTLKDYYAEVTKVIEGMINVGMALRNSHIQVTDVFAPRIDEFVKQIKAIQKTGSKEAVYKLNMDILTFRLELSSLIKSGHPENLLQSYNTAKEERTARMWAACRKRLAKFDDATILLQWLVTKGNGVPMTIEQIASVTSKTTHWVTTHIAEIKVNAPELIVLGVGVNDKTTYYVPKDYHPYLIT